MNPLLSTPLAFLAALAVAYGVLWLCGKLALKSGAAHPAGRGKAYACGEDVADHRAQPDYEQFFPFAFFFTIMHVLALVVVTVPAGSLAGTALAIGYAGCLAVGLLVLFRR